MSSPASRLSQVGCSLRVKADPKVDETNNRLRTRINVFDTRIGMRALSTDKAVARQPRIRRHDAGGPERRDVLSESDRARIR